MEKIIKKRQDEVLTVFVFKRIVRFFATDEVAVMKRRSIARFSLSRIGYSDTVVYLKFKRSLTNRLPISVSALSLTLFERQTR